MNTDNKSLKKELDRMLQLYKKLEFDQKLNQNISQLKKLADKQEQLAEQGKANDEQKADNKQPTGDNKNDKQDKAGDDKKSAEQKAADDKEKTDRLEQQQKNLNKEFEDIKRTWTS
ncbi:hypothetical protein HK413_08625 [Mucilaginibacter sp. S1162]|uniref:Uncharacterized protein n=1 Tax=Mucilaginibacter humi TaxID=2732510 RepID=A0ABX1W3F6_9SPHI|nr:hypothetical protein [Mucilaginibacter humi]NNU34191.1 hypothetical protein [Mucilaginibacter humi]